jgi:hypothetical protein
MPQACLRQDAKGAKTLRDLWAFAVLTKHCCHLCVAYDQKQDPLYVLYASMCLIINIFYR